MTESSGSSAASPPLAERLAVIHPRARWRVFDWRELWAYRELLSVLMIRDIKVRYRQTVLGGLWAVLQPVATMLILWVVFGRLVRVPSDGFPYPLFVFAALLPWMLFANSVGNAGGSLVSSASLITKVYFPRLIIPLSSVGANLLDFAISFIVLLVMLSLYGYVPTSGFIVLPVLLLGIVVLILGLGSLLSALTVAYRDFRFVVPFLIQVWFFATPVIYPASIVPSSFRWILFLNPMCGFVEGFRSAVLGRPFDWAGISLSLIVAFVLLFFGYFYFSRVERRLADII